MRECRRCGRGFEGHFNARFCGQACRREYDTLYHASWRAAHPKPPKPAPEIEPFPSEINREAFGHWLSGFTDGEGYFGLHSVPLASNSDLTNNRAAFTIQLRADDGDILRSIRSYWGCGNFRLRGRSSEGSRFQNPAVEYAVCAISDLVSVVVPHFEKFPLRAKKARDFLVWCEAVFLLRDIKRRSPDWESRMQRQCCKWTPAEHEQFLVLAQTLRDQRRYIHDSSLMAAAPH